MNEQEEQQQDYTVSPANQVYMAMVRATADNPVIFLDPNVLDREYFMANNKTVSAEDMIRVRDMMDAQIPGISQRYPDEGIQRIAGLSIDGRHFSMQQEIPPSPNDPDGEPFRYAFINLQGSNIEPEGVGATVIESSPLGEVYWNGFWGIHEGNHVDFEQHAHSPANNYANPGENEANAINAELTADREGIDWLMRKGQPDIAQAVIDFRALNAFSDPQHSAAAVLADEPGQSATVEHFSAARTFDGVMRGVVGRDLGLDTSQVTSMMRIDVETFNGHVSRLLEEGAFDNVSDNPYVREYIEAYSGAVQRQITDVRLAREAELSASPAKVNVQDIRGGAPVVTLNDGDQASLRIGGVTAPQFFAANADPGLAEQRIALAREAEPALEAEFAATADPSATLTANKPR